MPSTSNVDFQVVSGEEFARRIQLELDAKAGRENIKEPCASRH